MGSDLETVYQEVRRAKFNRDIEWQWVMRDDITVATDSWFKCGQLFSVRDFKSVQLDHLD